MPVFRCFSCLFLFALLWFAPLGWRSLITPDEGRYAEIAREMAISGDWLTPRLNTVKYFEKPPLQYWASAALFRCFGESDFVARLWPALTGFFAVLATFFAARRLFCSRPDKTRIAFTASVFLGSCPWWVGNGHFLTLDMGLSSFLAMALYSFLWAQQDDATPKEQRLGMLCAWTMMAFAVLSKGLIGVVIPAGVLGVYLVWHRDARLLRRLHLGYGIPLFLAIVAPWFVWVSIVNPEFPSFFFIREHFQRYFTPIANRGGEWYYFIPIVLAGFFPWIVLLPRACFQSSVCYGSARSLSDPCISF